MTTAPADRISDTSNRSMRRHVCWIYDDAAALRAQAVRFLLAGREAGHRLEYIGSGDIAELRRDIQSTAGRPGLGDGPDLTVRSLDDRYGPEEVVDPIGQVTAYAAATEAALADGYQGLRVVADATALVRTPAQREAFARYEHLVDRYMVGHPFSAMCAYDGWELGAAAAEEIACLHPHGNGGSAFRWWAAGPDGMGLQGEVDIACRQAFDTALARTMPLLSSRRVDVDAAGLQFIDHRGLLALDRHARDHGHAVLLRTQASAAHRLAGLLNLEAVEVTR